MILDSRLAIAVAATLNTATGTNNLTNVIDLSTNALNAVRDMGNGEPVYLILSAQADITSGGTATLAFQLVSDSVAAIQTNGSQVVHAVSRTVTVPASATVATGTKAGTMFWIIALPQGVDYKQYLGVQQVVGTAVLTAGAVNCHITADLTGWRPYSDFT